MKSLSCHRLFSRKASQRKKEGLSLQGPYSRSSGEEIDIQHNENKRMFFSFSPLPPSCLMPAKSRSYGMSSNENAENPTTESMEAKENRKHTQAR